ncbi:MAG: hypothetical protein HRU03_06460 [Nanoarchaeales archaeon]|nr:hypothetical protein [Nanoarchaeales archaeon]
METINPEILNQLSQFSIDEIQENAEKVFDLIQLSKAREDELSGEFVDAEEVFASLER